MVICERCGRRVKPGDLWTLVVALPAEGRVEREVCVVCATELRRVLLAVSTEERAAPGERLDEPSRPARFGWLLTRWAIYLSVAIVAFALATWLADR